MLKFWVFKTKILPFFAKIDSFENFFTYNFQTPLWIFLSFGMEAVLMVFFEKNHMLCARKILIWQNFGHLRPKFGHFFAKIDSFERFWPLASKQRFESS